MSTLKAKIYKGRNEMVGTTALVRSMPNPKFNAIGSVVFLDHVVEKTHDPKPAELPDGSFEHPHRGIATFTYVIEGGVHHLDSNGGEGIVYSGGIQWMNSGNGITHDEFAPLNLQEKGGKFHAFQFWLNLPAKNKAEKPDYLAVQSEDIAEIQLPNEAGLLRVLLGDYKNSKSIIPAFLGQSIYHIKLAIGKSTQILAKDTWQYGVYIIKGNLSIDNTINVTPLEIAELSDFGKNITLTNKGNEEVDFIFMAGEPYNEPMIAHGPFIMNNEDEIHLAFDEFKKGKYGKVDYSKVQ